MFSRNTAARYATRYDEEASINVEDIVTVNEDTEIIVIDVHEEARVEQHEFYTAIPNRAEAWYQDKMSKCNICDYASARKGEISDHKTTIHNW